MFFWQCNIFGVVDRIQTCCFVVQWQSGDYNLCQQQFIRTSHRIVAYTDFFIYT